jgi:glycosyltransferase involved in cell wall biosynthesis
MEHCVSTLLAGGDAVEVLIVDDGSTDRTGEIADRLQKEHPGIVKAIHQANGGHGEAVNTGLSCASGVFFKVVDSDDWVNESAYQEILEFLSKVMKDGMSLDMLISNFVYEKQGAKRKKVMSYHHAIPEGQFLSWKDIHGFRLGHYILMHSVIYRTQMLKDSGLRLPAHTFYVDNIFVYQPLVHVKTLYYMDVNFYRYYIGREDQSVNEKVMISRIDQQILINKLMIDTYNLFDKKRIPSEKLRHYMFQYLEIITVVSSILLIRSGTAENLEKKIELWKYLKKKSPRIYLKMRWRLLGRSVNLPGKGGRKVSEWIYEISQKFYGFN